MATSPIMIHYYSKERDVSIIRIVRKNGRDIWIRAKTYQNDGDPTPVRVDFVRHGGQIRNEFLLDRRVEIRGFVE